jgi:hypothetical protein
MPDTWSTFSGSDIGLALIGIAGFVSVWVVLSTALGRTVKREISLRNNARAQSQARD